MGENDKPDEMPITIDPDLSLRPKPKASILIVDDELMVAEVIRAWLQADGYDCDYSTNGEEVFELFGRKAYDLLISDIMMPDISGIELLGRVRGLFPDIAVVMATAVDDRNTANQALKLGADGYVIKPFHMNEFLINIANVLEKKRLNLESGRYKESLEEKVRERTAEVREREEEIALRLITATGYRDGETGEHIKRIGLYCVAMAEALGWDRDSIDNIRIGAPMHDVGKIGIPDKILRKPCRLSSAEFGVIKEHSKIGATILDGSKIPLLEMAADIALSHHERWDGEGYPNGLRGEDISEAARIVAIADVYDALCHDRVYRKAYSEADAIALMNGRRGSYFDPLLHDCFFDLLPTIRRIRMDYQDTGGLC
ncbi:MAG: response regulator [Desulfobulbales bacterium]|nr:response regulator [Desulfobulbales bacterium]